MHLLLLSIQHSFMFSNYTRIINKYSINWLVFPHDLTYSQTIVYDINSFEIHTE
jgi:hypothetical protein